MSSWVLALPLDVLAQLLGSHGWRDTQHIALTCKRFNEATKRRAYWMPAMKRKLAAAIPPAVHPTWVSRLVDVFDPFVRHSKYDTPLDQRVEWLFMRYGAWVHVRQSSLYASFSSRKLGYGCMRVDVYDRHWQYEMVDCNKTHYFVAHGLVHDNMLLLESIEQYGGAGGPMMVQDTKTGKKWIYPSKEIEIAGRGVVYVPNRKKKRARVRE